MIINATPIYIAWGYQPLTQPAIKWHRLSSGNWRGSDRGALEDKFKAKLQFNGTYAEIEAIEAELNTNRNEALFQFNAGEEIFGADIDHSGQVSCTVTEYGRIQSEDLNYYSMEIEVRNLDPIFKSVDPDFSKLRLQSHSYGFGSDFDIQKMFTYDNAGFSFDGEADAGTFTGVFTQTRYEMPAIRRYLLDTARATTIAFPTFGGITEPFGPRMGEGPFNCKIIQWSDSPRTSLIDWNLSITFAREF